MRRRGGAASGTGAASADGGGVANSGVLHIETLVVHLAEQPGAVAPAESRDALAAYALRVREAYGRLDLEVLTPLSDQGEQQPIELREVFVPPGAREGVPPVALPRELVRRLTERGECGEAAGAQGADEERAERPVEPVLDVLADAGRERLVLLGDPGAGKSTLGRYLTLWLTQGASDEVPAALRERLPLLVELRRCAEPRWRDATFEEFLDHLHGTEGLSVPPRVLRASLSGGRAVVVFDGLDELFDPELRQRTAHRIAAFASRHPGVRTVVTSRIVGYRPGVFAAAGFTHHTLQDLTEEQIAAFARRWYATACPGDRELAGILVRRVTDAVAHSRAVRELAGNPLLLTVLAIVGRRGTLPRDRQGVYEHAVTVLLAHWDRDTKHLAPAGRPEIREVLELLEARDLGDLLRQLARRMQDGAGGIAGNHLHADELRSVIRDFLAEYELPPVRAEAAARAMVDQLRSRNFILSHYGGDIYGFVHRTFLEYLAASDLAHRYQEGREWSRAELITEVLGPRVTEPAWREVLLLVAGQLGPADAAAFVDHLLATFRSSEDEEQLAFAVRTLAEIRRIGTPALVRRSEAVIDTLTGWLTHRPWAATLLVTAQPAVATFGDYWAGRPRFLRWFHLHGQFLDGGGLFGSTPGSFATAFYRAPGTPAVLAVHAPGPDVRAAALRASGRQRAEPDDALRELILDRVANDPHPGPRRTALAMLVEAWPDEARTPLAEHVVDDPDPGVRRSALRALTERWPAGTRALLARRAAEDPHPLVRRSALTLLDEWATDLDRRTVEDRLALEPDPGARRVLLGIMARRWPDETRGVLAEHAVHDPDPGLRRGTLRTLAERWPGETREILLGRAVDDPDPGARRTALTLLAEGWPTETRGLLAERVVADPHPMPRQTALQLLVWRWSDEVRDVLADRALHDPDPQVRGSALALLAARWSTEVRRLVAGRLVDDPGPLVRGVALQLLATHGSAEIRETLRDRALRDDDPPLRAAALELLARRWPEEARRLVADRAVGDPDPATRATALWVLAWHWPDRAAGLVRDRSVAEPEPAARLAAFRMWAVAEPDGAPTVADRLRADPAPEVRAGIAWTAAFGWYADTTVRAALGAVATDDADPEVRAAATAALATARALAAHADHG
ncbi:HEAT repeat domain-containing protein [Streptomyces profundus]|uniref:HEAT repeat domain-containing protein n=1 Tax=Streptomyces profundus TaxID=2867410 RepID=UPI001D16CB45|nr:HEAT repeat domain-containing protein [Streptomyces sp. MA3_2.13]UED86764.1 HEAT repeat domain-containing protein [Streptomyces sp. MA3_2.13]